jgi:hypothetical protein
MGDKSQVRRRYFQEGCSGSEIPAILVCVHGLIDQGMRCFYNFNLLYLIRNKYVIIV